MTREDIQLLLADLCARLPYSPFVQLMEKFDDEDSEYFREIHNLSTYDIELFNSGEISNIKPYLRPMSSMTEEEKEELLNHVLGGRSMEYFHITRDGSIDGNQEAEQDLYNLNLHWLDFGPLTTSSYIDWLNKNMFDYRGLIPKDLALSTEEFNPYI